MLYLVENYDKEHKLSVADVNEKFKLIQWLFFQASGQGYVFCLLSSSIVLLADGVSGIQTVLRPGGVVHEIPSGEAPERDRALPKGDPPRARRARERALQAGVARRWKAHRCRPFVHHVRRPLVFRFPEAHHARSWNEMAIGFGLQGVEGGNVEKEFPNVYK